MILGNVTSVINTVWHLANDNRMKNVFCVIPKDAALVSSKGFFKTELQDWKAIAKIRF